MVAKKPDEKSCGVVLFREDPRREYLILHYPGGHLDFAKGHVEKGEERAEKRTALRELEEETGIKTVEKWEKSISVPIELLKQSIHEELRTLLRDGKLIYETRRVTDTEARAKIEEFIQDKKQDGVTTISIFDIFTSLLLPMEQIERIVKDFEEEGRISEIDG